MASFTEEIRFNIRLNNLLEEAIDIHIHSGGYR